MSKQTLTFDEWFAELKRVAISEFQFTEKSVATLYASDWKTYYDDGYTPIDTWREDFSNA